MCSRITWPNACPLNQIYSTSVRTFDYRELRDAALMSLYPAVLPDFSVACRRYTPAPGYLEALTRDNVRRDTSDVEDLCRLATGGIYHI